MQSGSRSKLCHAVPILSLPQAGTIYCDKAAIITFSKFYFLQMERKQWENIKTHIKGKNTLKMFKISCTISSRVALQYCRPWFGIALSQGSHSLGLTLCFGMPNKQVYSGVCWGESPLSTAKSFEFWLWLWHLFSQCEIHMDLLNSHAF